MRRRKTRRRRRRRRRSSKQGPLDSINETVDVSHKYSKQYYCQCFHV